MHHVYATHASLYILLLKTRVENSSIQSTATCEPMNQVPVACIVIVTCVTHEKRGRRRILVKLTFSEVEEIGKIFKAFGSF